MSVKQILNLSEAECRANTGPVMADLAQLAAEGVLRATQVVGQQGGWRVMVNYGRTEQALATQRGKIRIFPTLEKAVDFLADAGITNFDVDASYNPNNNARTKQPAHNAGVGENITMRPTIECTEELKRQIQKAIEEIAFSNANI